MRPKSLIIDRTFPSIGRVKLASGTDRRPVFNEINAMISRLWAMGELDLLSMLRAHKIAPLQMLNAYRAGRLNQLPTANSMVPFAAAFKTWRLAGNVRKGRPWSTSYAEAHALTEKQLLKHAPVGATIAELPGILRTLRAASTNRKSTFDKDRMSVLSFLRDTCTRNSEVYKEVSGLEAYNRKRMVKVHPMSVEELLGWTESFDADTATHCWAMATTGMRPIEYFGEPGSTLPWEWRGDHVWIAGAKKAGDGEACTRSVPDLGFCRVRPTTTKLALSRRISKRVRGLWTSYDLRRTYANWLEELKFRPTRIKLYMGHTLSDVTELYMAHDVTPHLREDAAILRSYIDARIHDSNHAAIKRVVTPPNSTG